MSNAKNTEVLRLSISGKILSVINLSKRFLRLKPNKDGKVKNNLMLSTEKQDLKILRMSFKENKKNSPSWQSESVLFIKYAMTMTDSADADGYYTYSLDFSFDIAPTKTVSGYFFLDTNHPKKKTIKIRGMILPIKEEEK